MSFWTSLLGSNPIGAAGSLAFNSWQENRSNKAAKDGLVLGNALDLQNQKDIFDYRINQAMDHGLTAWEAFLGPAGGAGGGTTGSGGVLGNQGAQAAQNTQALQMQSMEKAKDRAAQLKATEIQGDTARDVAMINQDTGLQTANIGANATKAVAQLRNQIEKQRLALDKRVIEEKVLPLAAQELEIGEQRLKEAINKVATSDPEFLKLMKRYSMSLNNVLSEFVINGIEVNPLDEKAVKALPEAKRKEIITLISAIDSHVFKEASGLAVKGDETFRKLLDQHGEFNLDLDTLGTPQGGGQSGTGGADANWSPRRRIHH